MEEEEHSSDYESQSESEEDCNIDEYFGDKEEEKQKRL